MKIKTITRSKVEQKKQTKDELPKLERNLDPALHPFAVEREYARALNAAKLEKLFAKPFVAAMSGHLDGIYCLRRHPTDIKTFLSGSFDGGVRVWNVANRQTKWSLTAHDACVRGVVVCSDNESFLTCSDDKTVKRWRLETSDDNDTSTRAKDSVLSSWSSQSAFTDIDVQRASSKFVTSGSTVELWDLNRSDSLSSYDWGVDSYIGVKFSPVEKDVFASLATDRGILLYDVRTNSILRKCVLPMRSNKIVWNPMEAFNFTVANEDHKLYTFDMRNLSKASVIHKGHVGAVLSLDYSPTGREFVSGSYDTTIRIFPHTSSRSRAVYHTQRMQRVFATQFTGDAQFVLSGSDDGNIRVWKSKASAPLRIVSKREKKSIQYRDSLRKKFRHMPEVARIERHQHLPKAIYKKREIEIVSTAATRKREANKAKHSRPETKEEKQKKLSKVKSVVANIE